MNWTNVRVKLGASFVALVVSSVPWQSAAAAEPITALDPRYDGPTIETRATREALARMATHEDQYAQTLLVTTHLVITKVAGDEEFRALYGATQWDNEAEARLEAADNHFYSYWGIDVVVTNFYNWDSNDQVLNCALLNQEVQQKFPHGTADLVAGFTNQNTGLGGCAEVNGNGLLIDWQSATVDWKSTQHELSHIFAAGDASGGAHPNDVMEDPYNFPNTWCNVTGWDHWGVIDSHKGKFD